MEAIFEDLRLILEEQSETIDVLKELAREHNRALCQLNLDSLKEVIGKEETFFKVFREQEENRGKTAAGLADYLGLPKDSVLPVFINKAPEHLADPLTGLLNSLTRSLEELAETNRLNNLLTRQALGVNEMIFKIINSTGEKVYNPKGVIEGGHRISLLDKKA